MYVVEQGQAIIDCPCGNTPYVPHNRFTPCDPLRLDNEVGSLCNRWFLFTGSDVRVATCPPTSHEHPLLCVD